MSGATVTVEAADVLSILAHDLQSLARLHDREVDSDTLVELRGIEFPQSLCLILDDDRAEGAHDLLGQSLAQLETPTHGQLDELAADFADIYLNHGLQASPCESVWLDEDGLAMQQPMFQIREWYAKYGLMTKNWRIRSDDHLALQLQFLAELLHRAQRHENSLVVVADAARFLDEHLLRWIDDFSQRIAQRCGTAFYAGSAMLTASYVHTLRDLLAELLDDPRPSTEEIEQRMRPKAEPIEVPLHYMPGTSPSW